MTQAGGVSALSFICPMLRHLPGDLFQIKKKARLYGQLQDRFVQPILDAHFRNFDENKMDNFISAYIGVIRSLQDEDTKKHVNGMSDPSVMFGGMAHYESSGLLKLDVYVYGVASFC